MKIVKFGGSSVGALAGRSAIKNIAEHSTQTIIVVVSALSGVTDRLIKVYKLACDKLEFEADLEKLKERHLETIKESVLVKYQNSVTLKIEMLLDELSELYYNIVENSVAAMKKEPEAIECEIVSYGEQMSSIIIQHIFEHAEHIDAMQIIKTNQKVGCHTVNFDVTNRLIQERFKQRLNSKIAVIGGFISKDVDNDKITNLGRGGSDFTASIMAAALDVETLEIYTDVDGFLTADPRVIKRTNLIPKLNFTEAMELCQFGAKVIYAPTIYPAQDKNIPIAIKNTFNERERGTIIENSEEQNRPNQECTPKGLTVINDTTLINIRCDEQIKIELSDSISNELKYQGIEPLFIYLQKQSIIISIRSAYQERVTEILEQQFNTKKVYCKVEIIANLSTIAIIGLDIGRNKQINSDICQTLKNNNIELIISLQNQSENSVLITVKLEHSAKAQRVIHALFFEYNNTISNEEVKPITTISTIDKLEKSGDKIVKIVFLIHNRKRREYLSSLSFKTLSERVSLYNFETQIIDDKSPYYSSIHPIILLITTNRYRKYPLQLRFKTLQEL